MIQNTKPPGPMSAPPCLIHIRHAWSLPASPRTKDLGREATAAGAGLCKPLRTQEVLPMRFVYWFILLMVVVVIAVFAVQNNEDVTLRYLDRSFSTSLPILVGAVYLLGMVSGWTVVGLLTRSLRRVTQRPH